MAALTENSFIFTVENKEISPKHWEECEVGKRLLERNETPDTSHSREAKQWEEG